MLKKLFFVSAIFIFLLIKENAYCDILPDNSHRVEIRAKITNLKEFSDIVILEIVYNRGSKEIHRLKSDGCLFEGYSGCYLEDIYAVRKDYLSQKKKNKYGKDINYLYNYDWSKDNNAVKSSIEIHTGARILENSDPTTFIEEFYRIIGFTDTSVVIFKWKEVKTFNNGMPASIKTYTYDKDTTKLYKKLISPRKKQQ